MLLLRLQVIVRGYGPALFLWCSFVPLSMADPAGQSVSDLRRQELVSLVRNDCGSCHGITMKGGLGSPLLPESLSGKPNISLRETILKGRPGTAMPGWSNFMNESEAELIVVMLKEGLPNAQ